MTVKIPNNEKRFSQPNNSDLFGNISRTKNVNFDEDGYVKLSARSVSLINQDDDADFNLPVSFGRKNNGFWNIVTSGDLSTASSPFTANTSETSLNASQDTGANAPVFGDESRGVWFKNQWHTTTESNLVYKDVGTGTDWTALSPSLALTTNKVHDLEVFRNRGTICITNGNTVVQIDSSYAASTNLTLPTDFETIGLSYNNNRMGIVTKISTASLGQNQDAYFFVWDGGSSQANQGFSLGTDMIVSIAPYKSSWVVLTRTGQCKYFNGGGFDELFSLPLYYLEMFWGNSEDPEAWGDCLEVDGDLIYININNRVQPYGHKGEVVIPTSLGGIMCYDPKVGLYGRHTPSLSPVNMVTVPTANVNTTTNIMTANAGTIYPTGNPVKYLSSRTTKIGGLQTGRVYYAIRHTSTQFSLAETKEDAINGISIDLTSGGDTTNYFMFLLVRDYGASRMRRTGGIGIAEKSTHAISNLIFGSELYEYDASGTLEHLNLTVSGFPNIGYFVTSKISSQAITDVIKKIFLKYRPLKIIDKIILKQKYEEVVGLPVTTPQDGVSCAWTSNKIFTTTADLSEVVTYLANSTTDGRECEVEIISGAGAGQMSQISSIEESGGTYTVTLVDEIDGASSGNVCDVLIENWKKLGEISNTEETFKEIPSAKESKASLFKVELRGVDTTIEELQIINSVHAPSA